MNRLAGLLALALPLAACGGGADEPAPPDDSPLGQLRRMGEAAQEVGRAAEEMQRNQDEGRPPAEPVDFRQLRELLPESVGGLPRTNLEGSRQGFGGMNVSQATATYAGEPDAEGRTPTLTLKVTDLGGLGSAAMFGAAWTLATVDRESDRDYERTTRIDGQPAYEKFDREARRGDFQAWVGSRFLVTAEGTGLSEDQLRDALRAVNFRRLEGMRDEGR